MLGHIYVSENCGFTVLWFYIYLDSCSSIWKSYILLKCINTHIKYLTSITKMWPSICPHILWNLNRHLSHFLFEISFESNIYWKHDARIDVFTCQHCVCWCSGASLEHLSANTSLVKCINLFFWIVALKGLTLLDLFDIFQYNQWRKFHVYGRRLRITAI